MSFRNRFKKKKSEQKPETMESPGVKDELIQLRDEKLLLASNKLSILPHIQLKHEIFSADKLMLFVHIPKTSGTTVYFLAYHLLRTDDSPDNNAWFDDKRPFRGNFEDVYAYNNKIRFVAGHMPFLEGEYGDMFNFISIVRYPVDRWLSLINFWYQRKVLNDEDIDNILAVVSRKEFSLDNLQTRWLAGESYIHGECTEETLEKAKENIINKFKLVAPLSDTNLVMAIISNHFGHDKVALSVGQISGFKKVTKGNIDLCDKIAEINRFDIRLFEFVSDYWEQWKRDNLEDISYVHEEGDYFVVDSDAYAGNGSKNMSLAEINAINDADYILVGITQQL